MGKADTQLEERATTSEAACRVPRRTQGALPFQPIADQEVPRADDRLNKSIVDREACHRRRCLDLLPRLV